MKEVVPRVSCMAPRQKRIPILPVRDRRTDNHVPTTKPQTDRYLTHESADSRLWLHWSDKRHWSDTRRMDPAHSRKRTRLNDANVTTAHNVNADGAQQHH
jgi:hypothetical protein